MVDLFADIPEAVIECTLHAIWDNLDKVEVMGSAEARTSFGKT